MRKITAGNQFADNTHTSSIKELAAAAVAGFRAAHARVHANLLINLMFN